MCQWIFILLCIIEIKRWLRSREQILILTRTICGRYWNLSTLLLILSWRRAIALSLVEFCRIRFSCCFIIQFTFTLLSILGLRIIAIKLTDAATPCCVNHFLGFINFYQFAIDCSLRYTCLVFIIELIVCGGLIGSSGRI